MRIALLSDWALPRLGGIERQMQGLATQLVERGHDVRVITFTPVPDAVGAAAAVAAARRRARSRPRALVLLVHPWELVDLRGMAVRWDCPGGTGEHAERSTISALVEERGREDARQEAHDRDRDEAHR